jgi:predicted permease
MTGLMTLAGLILLAACANLGSLFAARAADRSREVALRLALGASRGRILRQLFTEAVLLSAVGGAVGIWASVIVLSTMSTWQPIAKWPMQLTVNPDANVYGVAVLLSLTSGFLFGAVPIRQVMDADPYEIIKSGTTARTGRRFTIRDFALGLQIALCALLVTSSFVAIRGLARTMSSNFGFEPRGAMLADTDLHIAGYSDETTSGIQKKIIEALRTIPGVNSVGFINEAPLAAGGFNGTLVFHDDAVDLKSSSAVTDSFVFGISPDYFEASGTPLLTGRTITWHDDKNAPRVGVINELLARKAFGSATNAMSKYFKTKDGTRIQVVGVVEDGKYQRVMEEQQSAMFLPILQSPSSESYFVVRSDRDAAQLTTAIRNTVRALDAGLALYIQPWDKEMETALFASRMAALALGILGAMGAMLSITGVFGMAAHSVTKRLKELGIRMALGAQWKEVLKAALGRTVRLLAFGSAAGLLLGLLASRVLALVVYSATPRDPVVLAGVVLAMAVLGLVATWIPAQRAMSIDPAKLMREE